MQGKEKKYSKQKKPSTSSLSHQQARGALLLLKALEQLDYIEKKEEFLEKLLCNQPKRARRDEQMTFLQGPKQSESQSCEEQKQLSGSKEEDGSMEIADPLTTPIMINPNHPIKDPGKLPSLSSPSN